VNYHIHTDAIKAHLIPVAVTPEQVTITYANEADIQNVALFGPTAKQWQDANPKLGGNMRGYATVEQFLQAGPFGSQLHKCDYPEDGIGVVKGLYKKGYFCLSLNLFWLVWQYDSKIPC
jgi:hypothetical protein